MANNTIEQIIHPTSLINPQIVIKPNKKQIDNLLKQIQLHVKHDKHILITTLTKKITKKLTAFLTKHSMQIQYLHSNVNTLRHVKLLTELQAKMFNMLIDINLLHKKLNLPKMSLITILNTNKENFLRSNTSLIQTISHATHNITGKIHIYTNNITNSMTKTIKKTDQQRKKQITYNTKHNIKPKTLHKHIANITKILARKNTNTEKLLTGHSTPNSARQHSPTPNLQHKKLNTSGTTELKSLITNLNNQILQTAKKLKFKLTARLHDKLNNLKKKLQQIKSTGHIH